MTSALRRAVGRAVVIVRPRRDVGRGIGPQARIVVTHPYVNLYDLDREIVRFREDLILLRPRLRASTHVNSRCQVAIVVTPDMRRVFVGESEYEFPGIAYEVDTRAIETMAERFDLPELRRALALRTGARAEPGLVGAGPGGS